MKAMLIYSSFILLYASTSPLLGHQDRLVQLKESYDSIAGDEEVNAKDELHLSSM